MTDADAVSQYIFSITPTDKGLEENPTWRHSATSISVYTRNELHDRIAAAQAAQRRGEISHYTYRETTTAERAEAEVLRRESIARTEQRGERLNEIADRTLSRIADRDQRAKANLLLGLAQKLRHDAKQHIGLTRHLYSAVDHADARDCQRRGEAILRDNDLLTCVDLTHPNRLNPEQKLALRARVADLRLAAAQELHEAAQSPRANAVERFLDRFSARADAADCRAIARHYQREADRIEKRHDLGPSLVHPDRPAPDPRPTPLQRPARLEQHLRPRQGQAPHRAAEPTRTDRELATKQPGLETMTAAEAHQRAARQAIEERGLTLNDGPDHEVQRLSREAWTQVQAAAKTGFDTHHLGFDPDEEYRRRQACTRDQTPHRGPARER